ncbi:MAG TPA: DUF1631 domain-containing protein [Casimicrobiaceae bacterium]|nr:DUF1631 domain-containing protein [Casimicrobiaceae bacterium]
MNATTPEPAAARRPPPRETQKILGDLRDLAVRRLVTAFTDILGKVCEALMDRANRTDVRDEQTMLLDARAVVYAQRRSLLEDFEKKVGRRIDDLLAGKTDDKPDFAAARPGELTLVETATVDESVVRGNLKRVIENLCYDELQQFNRGVGFLLDRPTLETDSNPYAPATIVEAFAEALREIKTETRIKFQVLKELNQASLADINKIYAELNKHLANLNVVPAPLRSVNVGSARQSAKSETRKPGTTPQAEVDVMALFQRMFAGGALPRPGGGGHAGALMPAAASGVPQGQPRFAPGQALPAGMAPIPSDGMPPGGAPMSLPGMHQGNVPTPLPGVGVGPMPSPGMPSGPMPSSSDGGFPALSQGTGNDLEFPAIQMPGAPPLTPSATRTFAPLPATPSGYVPAAPIISTVDLHEGLTRLQAGHSGFEIGGAHVAFSGIPTGLHNVLRDLQDSQLGQKANQLESMTIEMVAMLFDFIFETKDLPDGIKALLARLQIPVLKAAMLDGAFFAKKTHPARLLVNELAAAGLGWSPVMGQDDPLFREIERSVHAVLERFADDLALFEELRVELQAFLAEEEKAAESNIATTAEEINQRDQVEIASAVARSEIERRIESYPVPTFLAGFLRQHWLGALAQVYTASGEESEAWNSAVTTLEDLIWSVQPKRSSEDRKHLIALLPSLLKRLNAGMLVQGWPQSAREGFMSNLVEAHAAAVKPSLSHVDSPTAAVAEQAKAQAAVATAAGDDALASKAKALAEAMAPAPPPPVDEREILEDEYLEIARHLERGMWVEFENEDGQLAFAKLAWVSPLRGTYLFTNRQGQKALSITAEELAGHFRTDKARLVEAEPLIDRAVSSMLVKMEDRLTEEVE